MKRIWHAIGKTSKDAHFQVKAVKQVEKIEAGQTKVAAPKVPTEEKRFAAAQDDTRIREDLAKKHVKLVENMGKMTIESTDPSKREQSDRPLPTRDSEWEHRNDPIWEFGFYEPPEDKIPRGKLMFREALEILRARQEMDVEGSTPAAAKRRELGQEEFDKSKATARLDKELIDDIYEYFRPFERKGHQKVVNKHELAQLQDYLKGHTEELKLTEGAKEHVQEMLRDKRVKEEYERLDEKEKEQFVDAMKTIRAEEHARLEARLKQINQIEEGIKNASEEAKAKVLKEKELENK